MKFIVDECTGTSIALWLQKHGYVAFSIFDEMPGISDHKILEKANNENYIIITNDKDFGELIFRDHLPHKGVILLRLQIENFKK